MAKQIFLYKLAKDLAEQLNQEEEDLEQEYDANEKNIIIDNDAEDDGSDVLDEYDKKLAQFTMMQNDETEIITVSEALCPVKPSRTEVWRHESIVEIDEYVSGKGESAEHHQSSAKDE